MNDLAAGAFLVGIIATTAAFKWRTCLAIMKLDGGFARRTAASQGLHRVLDAFAIPTDTTSAEVSASVLLRMDGDVATVIGSEAQARGLGVILGQAPLGGLRRASTGVKAALDMAEATGHLVRLSPESAKAFQKLGKIQQEGGWVLAVLRDSDTKAFAHILRIRPLTLATRAASVTALVSAIAMQAQLDAIEKSVASVGRNVDRLHEGADAERWGRLRGAERLISEVYASARSTGCLTETMWEQVAPLAHTVYALQEEVLLRLQNEARHLRDDLRAGARDRADDVQKIAQRVEQEVAFAAAVELAVVQFQLLRLARLQTVGDPSLAAAAESVREQLESRTAAFEQLRDLFVDSFANTDVSGRIRQLRAKPRAQIRRHVEGMRAIFDARLGQQSASLQSFIRSTTESADEPTLALSAASSDG